MYIEQILSHHLHYHTSTIHITTISLLILVPLLWPCPPLTTHSSHGKQRELLTELIRSGCSPDQNTPMASISLKITSKCLTVASLDPTWPGSWLSLLLYLLWLFNPLPSLQSQWFPNSSVNHPGAFHWSLLLLRILCLFHGLAHVWPN